MKYFFKLEVRTCEAEEKTLDEIEEAFKILQDTLNYEIYVFPMKEERRIK